MNTTTATFDQVAVGDTVLRFDGTGSVPVVVIGKTSLTDSGHRVIHTTGIHGGDITLGAGGTVDKLTPTSAMRRRVVDALNAQGVLDRVSITSNTKAVFVTVLRERGRRFEADTIRLGLEAEGVPAPFLSSIRPGVVIVNVR